MKINFSIQGKVDKDLTIDQLKKVLFKSMIKMQELATIYCPVDKGRLRNSINLKPATPGYSFYELSDAVDYGIHQEFGTINMSAQPFMRPAMIQVKQIWVKRYMDQVMKKGNNI
jgi:HK97 gp10 family phage protein